jgi:RNA polymerase sigma-70 factor (ECF subfamily)
VLVMRDVLQWKAAEVADAIGASTAAVNSLLQRARAQLDAVGPSEDDKLDAPDSPETKDLLDRYIAAFEAYDIDKLVEMFTEEAVWEMPPFDGWYQSPQAIRTLIHTQCPAEGPGDMRLMPTTANGQPAAGLYMRNKQTGVHEAFQFHVIDVRADAVSHVVAFATARCSRSSGYLLLSESATRAGPVSPILRRCWGQPAVRTARRACMPDPPRSRR